jgi:chain length determinant protein (polysaccharide antigen chain regulator)
MAVNASNQQSVILSDENLLNNNPLYLFGTEALEVEIKALSERASEESFVPGLRALQQRVDALNIIKINENDVKAAQIDQEAIPTSNRYSPKRKLIVFLGIIFGIFLSLIYIFFNIIFYRNKT